MEIARGHFPVAEDFLRQSKDRAGRWRFGNVELDSTGRVADLQQHFAALSGAFGGAHGVGHLG